MSLGLILLPMTFVRDDWAYSYTVLPVVECRALFEKLQDLPALQVPSNFSTYLARNEDPDESTANTQEDRHGDVLCYVRTQDLLQFKDTDGVLHYGNRGVWAYLEHLPKDSKVALYWT